MHKFDAMIEKWENKSVDKIISTCHIAVDVGDRKLNKTHLDRIRRLKMDEKLKYTLLRDAYDDISIWSRYRSE